MTVIHASADLDDQLNSIIETSWVIEWTLDDTRELLEKLEGKKFTVQLDDQSIEAVKGIHSEFFANEKKLIEEAQQDIDNTLSQHRAKIRCESLDTKMASARSYGITVGKAISLALDRVDSFDTKLDGIKAFKFTAVLDNQSLEQIKAEQESLKEEYKKYLNEHKKTLNQLLEFEKSILGNHRKELEELTKQHGLWLSDKNFYITVAVIVFLLALFYLFGYLKARAVFT